MNEKMGKAFFQLDRKLKTIEAYCVIPVTRYEAEVIRALRASDPPSTIPEIWDCLDTGGWASAGLRKQLEELVSKNILDATREDDETLYELNNIEPAILIIDEVVV